MMESGERREIDGYYDRHFLLNMYFESIYRSIHALIDRLTCEK